MIKIRKGKNKKKIEKKTYERKKTEKQRKKKLTLKAAKNPQETNWPKTQKSEIKMDII